MRHADHPIFTRVYGVVAGVGEHTGLGRIRARVLAPAHGTLLIIGLGPGHDLEHVPSAVTHVIAVEPSASMRAAAAQRVHDVQARGLDVDVVDAFAESLPLDDDSVDCVLVAYVLCSVGQPDVALAEIHRVLRPGGLLLVLEHVRAPEGTFTRTMQRLVAPVWPRLTGGCCADRDTRGSLAEAGFDVTALRDVRLANIPPVIPTLVGTATVGV